MFVLTALGKRTETVLVKGEKLTEISGYLKCSWNGFNLRLVGGGRFYLLKGKETEHLLLERSDANEMNSPTDELYVKGLIALTRAPELKCPCGSKPDLGVNPIRLRHYYIVCSNCKRNFYNSATAEEGIKGFRKMYPIFKKPQFKLDKYLKMI